MSVSKDIARLQQIHQRGGLTDDQFAKAKAALLANHRDGLLDRVWTVLALIGSLIVALAIVVSCSGAGMWWQVLLVGLAVLAIDAVFGWLAGTFRRLGSDIRRDLEHQRMQAEEATAREAQEIASRAEEGRCLKCGGPLVGQYSSEGYGYTECAHCRDRTNIHTQYDQ